MSTMQKHQAVPGLCPPYKKKMSTGLSREDFVLHPHKLLKAKCNVATNQLNIA